MAMRVMFFRKDLFKRPILIESPSHCGVADAEFTCPIGKAHGLTIESEHLCPTGILALLQFCGPSAIFLRVWSVLVWISIDGRIGEWFWSHVLQEGEKRISPAITHYDSSATIKFVVFAVWVIASGLHGFPNAVFRRMRLASNGCICTTARHGFSCSKCWTSSFNYVSAFATAKPKGAVMTSYFDKLNDRQFPVDVSTFVFNAGRKLVRITGSHDRPFRAKGGCGKGRLEATTSGRLVSF